MLGWSHTANILVPEDSTSGRSIQAPSTILKNVQHIGSTQCTHNLVNSLRIAHYNTVNGYSQTCTSAVNYGVSIISCKATCLENHWSMLRHSYFCNTKQGVGRVVNQPWAQKNVSWTNCKFVAFIKVNTKWFGVASRTGKCKRQHQSSFS